MIKNFKKPASYFFIFFLLIIFFISLLLTEKFSQSFHFVDEDDHLVSGYYMNRGVGLYQELSSIHQPVVYMVSSLAQKVTQPQTIFNLLRTGREAVYLYALVWSIFLAIRYRWPFIFFSLFFELTKYFILGNLLLAESLVVYPLIFILGESFKVVLLKFKPKKWEVIAYGLANFLAAFCLLPVIPSLIFLNLIYLWQTKRIKLFLIGFIFPTIFLFLIFSPVDYFRETIFNNFKYVIPSIALQESKGDWLNFITFPILSFIKAKDSILNQLIQFFTILLFINGIFVFRNKQSLFSAKFSKPGWLFLLFTILLLNNRVLVPGEMYYFGSAFHLLPWYAAIIFFTGLTLEKVFKGISRWPKFLVLLVVFSGTTYFLTHKNMPYFTKIDKVYENNFNFLSYYLTGEAMKAVAQEKDRLAVFPDETLIYWQSGLNLASHQLIYADWQYQVPPDRQKMEKMLIDNPPEFIYADFKRIGPATYLPLLNLTLAEKYWQVTKNGVAQNIYLKKDKIKAINEKQWLKWQELSFDKVPLNAIQ